MSVEPRLGGGLDLMWEYGPEGKTLMVVRTTESGFSVFDADPDQSWELEDAYRVFEWLTGGERKADEKAYETDRYLLDRPGGLREALDKKFRGEPL